MQVAELRPSHVHAGIAMPHFGRKPSANVTVAWWTEPGAEAPREMTLGPGETLFYEGDRADAFFEIVSGLVRCCRLTPDGRRSISRFAGPGEMLGLGDTETHDYSAEAVRGAVVRRHRHVGLEAAIEADRTFRNRVMQALRDELAAVRLQTVMLGCMSAGEKMATFLLALAERCEDPAGLVAVPVTRADIADYLGLTLETISRRINELHRAGVIELVTPFAFRVLDRNALEALAEAA
jgi:CRP-like cAMP-binding protein